MLKIQFMPLYNCFFLSIVLSIIVILIRLFIQSRENIPVGLFIEALRNENSGHFEEAVITYESALIEFRKIRSHNKMKNNIIEKIKVLRTVIEYQKTSIFIRY